MQQPLAPNDQPTIDVIADADWSLSKLHLGFVLAARGSAIASLILCAVWASRNDSTYLTVPSWKTNRTPWHAILSVCGFFFSLIFGMTSWGVGTNKRQIHEVVFHIAWELAACATLSASLVAIFQTVAPVDKELSPTFLNTMTSIHSWLGIAAAGMFFFAFVFNVICSLIPPPSGTLSTHPLSFHNVTSHLNRTMGHATLLLTIAAIGSGIMEYQGGGGCDATVANPPVKVTPIERYLALPAGCKISNGLGITVMIAALFAVGAMGVRELYCGISAARAAAEVAASQQGVEASKEFKEKVYLAMTGKVVAEQKADTDAVKKEEETSPEVKTLGNVL